MRTKKSSNYEIVEIRFRKTQIVNGEKRIIDVQIKDTDSDRAIHRLKMKVHNSEGVSTSIIRNYGGCYE